MRAKTSADTLPVLDLEPKPSRTIIPETQTIEGKEFNSK